MLPMALAVSFSRVYNGVHYPSDVLTGAILGAGYAAALAITFETAWQRLGKKWFPVWHAQLPSLLNPVHGPSAFAGLRRDEQSTVDSRNRRKLNRKSEIGNRKLSGFASATS